MTQQRFMPEFILFLFQRLSHIINSQKNQDCHIQIIIRNIQVSVWDDHDVRWQKEFGKLWRDWEDWDGAIHSVIRMKGIQNQHVNAQQKVRRMRILVSHLLLLPSSPHHHLLCSSDVHVVKTFLSFLSVSNLPWVRADSSFCSSRPIVSIYFMTRGAPTSSSESTWYHHLLSWASLLTIR